MTVPEIQRAAGKMKRMTGRHVEYEDLVQAGWVGYLEAKRKYDGRGRFEAYAAKRIRGAMVDWMRVESDRRRHGSITYGKMPKVVVSDGPDPHEDCLRSMTRESVEAGVGELPKRERAVVMLRYWDEKQFLDISRILGVCTVTVWKLHQKAIGRLQWLRGKSKSRRTSIRSGATAASGTTTAAR